ncbi:hypothetical protein BU25DRAFT_405189 [Macroventuria anomochaeta]|uniref:Uncharacterized protein n=1 Tax=Macroventuria anomochaeta TaxID=301207 RepID=A0ACB6SH19_9PLEO|nr:uncharacterized protein BU25DRAFT_405189 [Macroventuria anomochaeta]KAF2633268.1 hypothetical protein BU25DRAFT_405189 [Macroventuria anomochaeta]
MTKPCPVIFCSLCGREHRAPPENLNYGTKDHPRSWCPLPEHLSKSTALIVDHNAINRKIFSRWLEKFDIPSDQATRPDQGLYMYQSDPMKYDIVCVDPMPSRTVTGLAVLHMIRSFERTNNVPPCFLICTNNSRTMDMGRISVQTVMDHGVDWIAPWHGLRLPLHDALAGIKERSAWLDRPDVMTKVWIPEILTDHEAARYPKDYPEKFEDENRFVRWPIPASLKGSTVLIVANYSGVSNS